MMRNGTHSPCVTKALFPAVGEWEPLPSLQCQAPSLRHPRRIPMTRSFSSGCLGASLALALLAGSSAARADFDASVIFAPIDACLELALQQQEGIVLGWRLGNAQATA